MTRILLIATAVLLVLVLGVGGCRKSGGSKGGYLPAPRGAVPAAGV
jgi:hypothetical protein